MIELDNRISYIRSVFADKVSMFQEIDDEHDFIQFETGSEVYKPDLAFIWDLTTNKVVETLY
jgi:hypothetical protein